MSARNPCWWIENPEAIKVAIHACRKQARPDAARPVEHPGAGLIDPESK